MNSYLKNIEENVPQDLWLEGESLYDTEGIFEAIKQVTRSLWNLKIKDDSTYEVEILIKSPKPKFTCECQKFSELNNCKHVVTALLKIRSLLLEKEATLQRKKENQIKRQTEESIYSTKKILENAHPEELKRFVKSIASKEQSFALALKVHFANKIDLSDNSKKYKQLLDSAVKPKNFKHKRMNITEKKDFFRLVESLSHQFEDCLSLKQYRECVYILIHVLDKMAYIRFNYPIDKVRHTTKEELYLNQLDELLQEKLPPELKAEIYDHLISLIFKSYYIPQDRNLIETCSSYFTFEKEHLKEMTAKFVSGSNLKDENTQLFVVALLSLFEQDKEILNEVIESVRLENIVNGLNQLYNLEKQKLLIKILLDLDKRKIDSKRLSALACKTYFENKKYKPGYKHLTAIIDKYNDSNLAIGLLSFIDEEELELFINDINKLFVDKPLSVKLSYYQRTGQYEKIIESFQKDYDLALLWQYDDLIADFHEDALQDIYIDHIKYHLDNHVGSAGKEAIITSFQHLQKLGLKKIKNKLSDFIREEYSHRKLLSSINV